MERVSGQLSPQISTLLKAAAMFQPKKSPSAQARRHRNLRNRTLQLEGLENRALMAADITLDQGSGVLYIEGTDTTRDTALIRIDTQGTASLADDHVLVSLSSKADHSIGRLLGDYSRDSVKSIVFNGYGGSDKFTNNTPIPSQADGGAGADILLGGSGKDQLYGGTQNDYLDGRAGYDSLYGGAGNDMVFGDKGNDYLYGGTGNDFLFGGAGRDSLWGESGDDLLDGGANTEAQMVGGAGADTFVDDDLSFPGGDLDASDSSSTTHSAPALFDYNVASDFARSSQRLEAYLASRTTPPATVNLNDQVLAFAQGKLGTTIGDGGCTRLVEAALDAAGGQPGSNFDSPGFYVWGRKLDASEAMSGGDIIQFAPGTRFETPTSSLWMDSTFGHAAIIESISGTTITMLNQNMAGSPVIRTTVDLSTIVAGSFSVYRAVPK
jgi:hypothetical protein